MRWMNSCRSLGRTALASIWSEKNGPARLSDDMCIGAAFRKATNWEGGGQQLLVQEERVQALAVPATNVTAPSCPASKQPNGIQKPPIFWEITRVPFFSSTAKGDNWIHGQHEK